MPKKSRSRQLTFDDKPATVRRRGHRKRKYRAGGYARTRKPARARAVREARKARKASQRKKRACTTVHVKAHVRKCPPTRKRSTKKRLSPKRVTKTNGRRTPRRNAKGRFVKS